MRLPGGQAGCCQLHFPSDELNFSGRAVAGSGSKSDFFFGDYFVSANSPDGKWPSRDPGKESGNAEFQGDLLQGCFCH